MAAIPPPEEPQVDALKFAPLTKANPYATIPYEDKEKLLRANRVKSIEKLYNKAAKAAEINRLGFDLEETIRKKLLALPPDTPDDKLDEYERYIRADLLRKTAAGKYAADKALEGSKAERVDPYLAKSLYKGNEPSVYDRVRQSLLGQLPPKQQHAIFNAWKSGQELPPEYQKMIDEAVEIHEANRTGFSEGSMALKWKENRYPALLLDLMTGYGRAAEGGVSGYLDALETKIKRPTLRVEDLPGQLKTRKVRRMIRGEPIFVEEKYSPGGQKRILGYPLEDFLLQAAAATGDVETYKTVGKESLSALVEGEGRYRERVPHLDNPINLQERLLKVAKYYDDQAALLAEEQYVEGGPSVEELHKDFLEQMMSSDIAMAAIDSPNAASLIAQLGGDLGLGSGIGKGLAKTGKVLHTTAMKGVDKLPARAQGVADAFQYVPEMGRLSRKSDKLGEPFLKEMRLAKDVGFYPHEEMTRIGEEISHTLSKTVDYEEAKRLKQALEGKRPFDPNEYAKFTQEDFDKVIKLREEQYELSKDMKLLQKVEGDKVVEAPREENYVPRAVPEDAVEVVGGRKYKFTKEADDLFRYTKEPGLTSTAARFQSRRTRSDVSWFEDAAIQFGEDAPKRAQKAKVTRQAQEILDTQEAEGLAKWTDTFDTKGPLKELKAAHKTREAIKAGKHPELQSLQKQVENSKRMLLRMRDKYEKSLLGTAELGGKGRKKDALRIDYGNTQVLTPQSERLLNGMKTTYRSMKQLEKDYVLLQERLLENSFPAYKKSVDDFLLNHKIARDTEKTRLGMEAEFNTGFQTITTHPADPQSDIATMLNAVMKNPGDKVQSLTLSDETIKMFRNMMPTIGTPGALADVEKTLGGSVRAFNNLWKKGKTVLSLSLQYTGLNMLGMLLINPMATGIKAITSPRIAFKAAHASFLGAFGGSKVAMKGHHVLKSGEKVTNQWLFKTMRENKILGQHLGKIGIDHKTIGTPNFLKNFDAKLTNFGTKSKLFALQGVWDEFNHAYTFLLALEGTSKRAIAEATDFAAKASGAYHRLSPFERTVMKEFVPFYAWQRFILPQTLKTMLANPQRTAALTRIVDQLRLSQRDKSSAPNEVWPKFTQPGIPTEADEKGMQAVYMLEDPVRLLTAVADGEYSLSALSPLMKMALSIYLHQNLRTGKDQDFFAVNPGGLEAILRDDNLPLEAKIGKGYKAASQMVKHSPVLDSLTDFFPASDTLGTYMDYVQMMWDSDKPGLKDRAADLALKAAMYRRTTGIPKYVFDPLQSATGHAWNSDAKFEQILNDLKTER